MIRGRGSGLEISFSGRPFGEALEEIRERFKAGPEFYRGTQATVFFEAPPSPDELAALGETLAAAEIVWDGGYQLSNVARLPAREREVRQVQLSENARSLVADFAGARADLAERRTRRQRRRPEPLAPAAPTVLYHRGTLRGGQALANVGHLVVVGDVNPGAELVAGGDIVVFGALRGVAHAGAQGDASARVYALVFEPTQLRIATTIAAGTERTGAPVAEEAFLDGDRIAIVPAGQPPLHRPIAEQTST